MRAKGDVRIDRRRWSTAPDRSRFGRGEDAMNVLEPTAYRDVFEIVRQWPPEARRDLVRDVEKTLAGERRARPSRGFSADEAIGLLKSDRPAPTDEECDRILEEELMRKYGL
jgi:hypothetical protein